jgi:hypothetical protein
VNLTSSSHRAPTKNPTHDVEPDDEITRPCADSSFASAIENSRTAPTIDGRARKSNHPFPPTTTTFLFDASPLAPSSQFGIHPYLEHHDHHEPPESEFKKFMDKAAHVEEE